MFSHVYGMLPFSFKTNLVRLFPGNEGVIDAHSERFDCTSECEGEADVCILICCFLNELALLGRATDVAALYDVDAAKLGTYHNGATGLSMPVRHVDEIQTPFVVCVSMRNPQLVSFVRAAAERLGAIEGTDYLHFN